ncbi:unnamed protein product, partial [Effrenium voratum]
VCSVPDESTSGWESKYGFWLQHVAGTWPDQPGPAASQRRACLEEHPDPCCFAPSTLGGGSTWFCAALRGAAAELAVSVRLERAPANLHSAGEPAQALEMQGVLNFNAPILDIAPDEQSACQRYAVMLSDRIEIITIMHQAATAQQAPRSAAECCAFLRRLAAGAPEWLWSLDDAKLPSFEEQQRAQLLSLPAPKVMPGRWALGLLQFLALQLREVWAQRLVQRQAVAVDVASVLGFCSKRRRCSASSVLTIGEALARKISTELQPVIQYAREGLSRDACSAQVAPSSVVERSRLYVHRAEAASDSSAKVRVGRAVAQLLEAMDRARELLGFLEALHKSGRMEAVLQSGVLREEPRSGNAQATALALLCLQPLRDFVISDSTMWPVVQMCTALISEVVKEDADGAAGGAVADALCRELQERCPRIFAQVDLRLTKETQSQRAVVCVLRRYCSALNGDQLPLALRRLAKEDPASASDLCAEKIQELQVDDARDLLAALLDAICLDDVPATARAVESFLQRTKSWRGNSEALIHHMVVDHLLSSPRLHRLLEEMLQSDVVNWAEVLQQRANKSRFAGELLWKYHQQRGHARPAWAQLQRLVETPQFYSLKDRIRYLHQAKEQKKAQPKEELSLRLEAAEQLQLPLFNELQVLATEASDERWRAAARKRCQELNQLQGLKELYEVAGEFGLWHLQLAIAGYSGVKMAHDVATTLWVGLLFPPECLYAEAAKSPCELFPLLMLRRQRFFLSATEEAASLSPTRPLLRSRVLGFLQELREVAPTNHHLWHARCVATLLEFSNCLWLQSLEAPSSLEGAGDASAGSPLIDETRLWVATEVLKAEPFSLSLPDLVNFYAEMIAQLHAWHKDLQDVLPAKLREAALPSEEDVHLHLSQVAVVVVANWLQEADRKVRGSEPEGERDFARVWRRSADGLLAGLCLRLNRAKNPVAQRLLVEVLRLEKACRLLLERVVYLGPETQRVEVHSNSG